MTACCPIDRARAGSVVVTYFPSAGFERRLSAMIRETHQLIVADNSGTGPAQEAVRAVCAANGCEFVANSENLGLASALNEGFRRHATRDLTWAIAFDQDSTPEPGFVAALMRTAAGDGRNAPAVIVGANWRDEARPDYASRHLRPHRRLPFCYDRSPANKDLEHVTCVIASGTLFHLPTWAELGGFDETLFLDLVDSDYCLRAARRGHCIRVAAGAQLRHRRGAKRPVHRFGRTFWPAFMPPLRLRLLFRNRLRLMPRHLWRAPHWVAFEAVYAAKNLAEILAFEDRRFIKLIACIRGIWDGVLGRGGPIR